MARCGTDARRQPRLRHSEQGCARRPELSRLSACRALRGVVRTPPGSLCFRTAGIAALRADHGRGTVDCCRQRALCRSAGGAAGDRPLRGRCSRSPSMDSPRLPPTCREWNCHGRQCLSHCVSSGSGHQLLGARTTLVLPGSARNGCGRITSPIRTACCPPAKSVTARWARRRPPRDAKKPPGTGYRPRGPWSSGSPRVLPRRTTSSAR